MTKDEYVKKVNDKYGLNRYYVIGEYKNNKSKILIKCNVCGHTWDVNAGNFINVCKIGCPKCSCKKTHDEAKLTTDEIVKRGKELYGDRYSYDKVDSLNRDEKGRVCFTCNVCKTDFWERPVLFLSKNRRKKFNCPNCVKIDKELKKEKIKEKENKPRRVHDTESFIEKLNKKFPGFYDTSDVVYTKYTENVILYHEGKKIETSPASIFGNKKPIVQNKIKDLDGFIKRSKIVHRGKYTYEKSIYNGAHNPLIITCPIHGDFEQAPCNHLNGHGCPHCNDSTLELIVDKMLSENEINYIKKHKEPWLGRQHLDFYLPDHNVAIECQGQQHVINVPVFNDIETNIRRDKIKYEKCNRNSVKLLYLFPNNINIDDIIDNDLFKIYDSNNSFNDIDELTEFLKNEISYNCNDKEKS